MDLEKVEIKDDIKELLEAGRVTRFRERCGDVYLNGIISGGEFFAIYEINTSSQKDRELLEASMKGSYGIFSGSAKFKKSLEEISEIATINITIHRVGDIGTKIPQTAASILEYAVNFPSVIAKPENAVIYKVLTLDYKTLDLPGDTESILETKLFEDEVKFLARKDNEYDDAMQSIIYVLDHPKQFINLPTDKKRMLNTKLSNLRDGQRAVQRKASACFDRRDEDCFKPFEPKLPDTLIDSLLPMQREVSETEPPDISARQDCDDPSLGRSVFLKLRLLDDKSIQIIYKTNGNDVVKLNKKDISESDRYYQRSLSSKAATRIRINNCVIVADKEVFKGSNCYHLHKKVSLGNSHGRYREIASKCIFILKSVVSASRAQIKEKYSSNVSGRRVR